MKKVKGIPKRIYSTGRPVKYDFSNIEIGEGISPATRSMIVCAKRYGRLNGKKFIQRKNDKGIVGIYRES